MKTKTAVVATLAVAGLAAGDWAAPIVTIDLDLPPAQRWVAFTQEYGARANVTLHYLQSMVGKGTVLHPIVESLRKAVLEGGGWTADHLAEMQGIADTGGFALTDIQYANLFYEFGTLGVDVPGLSTPSWKMCTSIVAQDVSGAILHARNQDYSLPGLTNITVQAQFTRSGKIVYQGNTFAGYIGLPTAMRPGGWSVSCDSRFNGGGVNLLENIKVAKAGGKTIGIMVRDALESAATYDDMIGVLNTTEVIAPAYYIVAGTKAGEGAVVTRNRDGPDQSHNGEGIWSIGKGGSYAHTGDWWRLETNFDHWQPLNDGRRGHANKAMGAIGQANLSFDTLEGLLSTKPVLASDTVYTAKMSPLKETYETIVRTGY